MSVLAGRAPDSLLMVYCREKLLGVMTGNIIVQESSRDREVGLETVNESGGGAKSVERLGECV